MENYPTGQFTINVPADTISGDCKTSIGQVLSGARVDSGEVSYMADTDPNSGLMGVITVNAGGFSGTSNHDLTMTLGAETPVVADLSFEVVSCSWAQTYTTAYVTDNFPSYYITNDIIDGGGTEYVVTVPKLKATTTVCTENYMEHILDDTVTA
jgi:hypothetical protein